MAKFKNDEQSLVSETLTNIREDRDLTYELINELRADLAAGKVDHKEVGFTAAKYMETLQRSNEQLVKIVAIIKKNSKVTDDVNISEEEAEELYEIIKEH